MDLNGALVRGTNLNPQLAEFVKGTMWVCNLLVMLIVFNGTFIHYPWKVMVPNGLGLVIVVAGSIAIVLAAINDTVYLIRLVLGTVLGLFRLASNRK